MPPTHPPSAVHPAGPFYLTLSGPRDAFPDLTDPAKLEAVKQAVKSALKLDNSYPLDNIQVWLQTEQEVPTPTPGRRLHTDNKVCCGRIQFSVAVQIGLTHRSTQGLVGICPNIWAAGGCPSWVPDSVQQAPLLSAQCFFTPQCFIWLKPYTTGPSQGCRLQRLRLIMH